jgi:hypothetical protein
VLIAAAVTVAGVEMARSSAPSTVITIVAAPPHTPPAPATVQSPERSAVGTLERIDLTTMHFILATSDGKLTFRLQSGATIRQGSRTLKPSELSGHTGERVKVRYREVGAERRASWLVLAARPSKGRSDAQGRAGSQGRGGS